ncbi:peptidoglycan-binding protein [Patescibacteria group bacterium]|nr:peptidoglycan-binding protein [Patescibacteria group bacterium]MBU1123777.1 peptidoglycan-binding protein [Patescibacteria group bacterium]MBU1911687.1 peptidoglycan-binding protein [Patescibacteria group bacterium]
MTNINTNPKIPRHILVILTAVMLIAPVKIRSNSDLLKGSEPFEQEFIITAYYSPIEGQCCYVKGGLKADKILNGEGIRSADGTGVYPGMIAAPSTYPFGTRILLPGLGTFEVNDRGGAITELAGGVHRLDVWVGHGEEGLARALSLGVRHIKGTVYPVNARKPEVAFDFGAIPTIYERLNPYMPEGGNFLAVRPEEGDKGPSVKLLQEYLVRAGYKKHKVNGVYDASTSQSLLEFIRDYQLDESSVYLTEKTAAVLLAAVQRSEAGHPISGFVEKGSALSVNQEAQRILRFLGYYSGRTDGEYEGALSGSILKFQQDYGLVGTHKDPGAGRIGPVTQTALRTVWNRILVYERARDLLDRTRVVQVLKERGEVVERFLGEGEGWKEVKSLQNILARKGYFPEDRVSGYFGPITKEAVIKYQLAEGLIDSADHQAAGFVGPKTLQTLNNERVREVYRRVRGEGWRVL